MTHQTCRPRCSPVDATSASIPCPASGHLGFGKGRAAPRHERAFHSNGTGRASAIRSTKSSKELAPPEASRSSSPRA